MIGLIILFILMVYVYIGYITVQLVMKKTQKKIYWILTIACLLFIPTGDGIIGKFYFNYFCKTEAGLKVYKTVNVDGFLMDQSIPTGDITKFEKMGFKYIEGINQGYYGKEIQHLNIDDKSLTIQIIQKPQSNYIFIYNEKSKPVFWLPIIKTKAVVKDRISNEVLGEDVGYDYFGTWAGIIAEKLVSGTAVPIDTYKNNPYKLLASTLKPTKGIKNGK